MKIYTLNVNLQGCDMDMWNHWIDSTIISYHKTQEGAESAMEELLKEREVIHPFIWDAKLGDARNIESFCENQNGYGPMTSTHKYFISEIEVLE